MNRVEQCLYDLESASPEINKILEINVLQNFSLHVNCKFVHNRRIGITPKHKLSRIYSIPVKLYHSLQKNLTAEAISKM